MITDNSIYERKGKNKDYSLSPEVLSGFMNSQRLWRSMYSISISALLKPFWLSRHLLEKKENDICIQNVVINIHLLYHNQFSLTCPAYLIVQLRDKEAKVILSIFHNPEKY